MQPAEQLLLSAGTIPAFIQAIARELSAPQGSLTRLPAMQNLRNTDENTGRY
jgi:hypothetical protein